MRIRFGLIWLSYFRLNTRGKTSVEGSTFTQSKPNTVQRNIFQNNMDDSSFHNTLDSILSTIRKSEQAYSMEHDYVINEPEMDCRVMCS